MDRIPGRICFSQELFITGVLVLIFATLCVSSAFATPQTRPFWTEKSAFIEGDDLFVVGVASKARTVEEARKQAFEQGKTELMNYAQITSLEAQGLVIETQMTFEEPNPDGTVTVYRLLRVPASKLVAIQGRVQAQSRLQEQTLEQSRKELLAIQQSLAQKQQDLDKRSREIESSVGTVSRLQVALGEKATKLDQQQKQVEQMLQQLTKSLQVSPDSTKEKPTSGSLIENLKQVEVQLDEREQDLDRMYRSIQERIRNNSQKVCRYITPAMKPSEVRGLLGTPDGEKYSGFDSDDTWSYGTAWVTFGPTSLVLSVGGCNK